MKRRRFLAVTVGVMVLSVGLVLANYDGWVTPAGAKDLNGVIPNWDQNLPSASRFTTVFPGAVRDNNTGLVWEQAPDPNWSNEFYTKNWSGALNYCVNKKVGGTLGWRLPSVVELNSLRDPSLPPPFVPASVFPGISPSFAFYWSATASAKDPTEAWYVAFAKFSSVGFVAVGFKTDPYDAWCVRGGMNADTY